MACVDHRARDGTTHEPISASTGATGATADLASSAAAISSAIPAAGLFRRCALQSRQRIRADRKAGLAVLNYERARLLDPNDPDIDANERHVRETSGLPAEPRGRFDRAARIASPQILAWAGVLGVLMIGISAPRANKVSETPAQASDRNAPGNLLHRRHRGRRRGSVPAVHGAVITRAAPVRVSPVSMDEPVFTLPEATMVRMNAEHDGFVLIQTSAGRTGWVPSANLAPIVPKPPGRRGKSS